MAMKYSSGFDFNALKQSLYSKQRAFNKDMFEQTEKGAEQIMAKSISNAPVDTHNLEAAHHITKSVTRADNVKFTVEVSGPGYGSDDVRDVANYAKDMHENLAPYGSGVYNLGEKSQAKADAGHDVGGMFLDRAVNELKPQVIENIRGAVRRFTQGKGRK